MSNRVALILETSNRNTYAVICNSRSRAEAIAELSPDEVIGIVPIAPMSDAIVKY